MKRINKQTGKRIRQLREAKDWTQSDLAEAAKLPVRSIGRIERADVDVRLSTLAKIANALGITVSELTK